jgi:hypothetical protein
MNKRKKIGLVTGEMCDISFVQLFNENIEQLPEARSWCRPLGGSKPNEKWVFGENEVKEVEKNTGTTSD